MKGKAKRKNADQVQIFRGQSFFYGIPHDVHDFLAERINEIGPACCWLYMVLNRYAGFSTRQTFVELPQICKDAGISRSTAYKYLATLEDLRLIHRDPKFGGGHIITILNCPKQSGQPDKPGPLFSEEQAKIQSGQPDNCPSEFRADSEQSPASRTAYKEEREERQERHTKPSANAEELDTGIDLDAEVPEPPDTPSQHNIVQKFIEACYSKANQGLPCPWSGRHGKVLKETLESLRWPDDDLLLAVTHRFASDVVLSEDPLHWIPRLSMYRSGPLNQFNKPKGRNKYDAATEAYSDRMQDELNTARNFAARGNH